MPTQRKHKESLHKHVIIIQRKAAAALAFAMTIFLFCVEHVKAFANQNSLSAHETLVLMSAASSMARKFSSAYIDLRKQKLTKFPVSMHISGGFLHRNMASSSTRLPMAWSMPSRDVISPITPSSLSVFGSWYNEMNPTSRSIVYDDTHVSDYSFSSPTDDWPTTTDEKEVGNILPERRHRKRPLRAIRRAVSRALGNGRSL